MSVIEQYKLDIPVENLPKHVAIIMDGNGRWAERRTLPRFSGHRAGVETLRSIVQMSAELGIKSLTLFAFSSENWRRPKKEVGLLMELFMTALGREVSRLHETGVKLKIIGDLQAFPAKLQKRINDSMHLTKDNAGLQVNIAANYGGKWDIVQATKKIVELVNNGEITSDEVTDELLNEHLCMCDQPEPDLFIRTGGEQRISNFLIWQLAYSELYFTRVLWPDFDRDEYAKAITSFATRQRRFGRTGAQVIESDQREHA
ncbi:Undecaprenyl diphosphate synthase [hydrothermal vent metagenome]|uniref:Undecaprenyl diphosphate synthase n=1 Tax=hydrothermal vent metagenome TaxID=652676 RepID=A0A3B1AB40_9ZZZZ